MRQAQARTQTQTQTHADTHREGKIMHVTAPFVDLDLLRLLHEDPLGIMLHRNWVLGIRLEGAGFRVEDLWFRIKVDRSMKVCPEPFAARMIGD